MSLFAPRKIHFAVALVLAITPACGPRPDAHAKRVIVLGIDGMDPTFLERHWKDLPNLQALASSGDFQRLATTTPPQSPVAWSTFSTGLNPGGHGVYDFIHRDPATLKLFSSLAEIDPPRWTLPLGPYRLPLSSGSVRRFRKGTTFWQMLDTRGTTYWATDDGVTSPTVEFSTSEEIEFDVIRVREYVPLGQRVEAFAVEAWISGRTATSG